MVATSPCGLTKEAEHPPNDTIALSGAASSRLSCAGSIWSPSARMAAPTSAVWAGIHMPSFADAAVAVQSKAMALTRATISHSQFILVSLPFCLLFSADWIDGVSGWLASASACAAATG
ncbi:conserved hypothetical protein [Mesorhizobium ventifaucium]|uniref:Uncharacterized protein n=1 Tax=Mesorhizobium ventifaucium TaxID=666020 RepID=A0ABN8JAD2_9HYPH|nr:conserved hypothetical protein [Mesorhizobium ventifaucium]